MTFYFVIPSWNRSRVIMRTLNSIASQKEKEWYAIIVDDGSTDDTRDVIKPFLDKHKNKAAYIKKENGGIGSARNKGIEFVLKKTKKDTDWVIFLDSDDSLIKNGLSVIKRTIKRYPSHKCYFFGAVSEEGILTFYLKKPIILIGLKELLKNYLIGETLPMVSVSVFRNNKYRFDEIVRYNVYSLFFELARDFGIMCTSNIARIYYQDVSYTRSRIQEKNMRNVYNVTKSVIDNWGHEMLKYNRKRYGSDYLVLARASALTHNRLESIKYFLKGLLYNPLDFKRIGLYVISFIDYKFKLNNFILYRSNKNRKDVGKVY